MMTQLNEKNIQDSAKISTLNRLSSYKLHLGLAAFMVLATLLMPINQAYAETPREIFENAKLQAEADFADAIIEAKSKLQTIRSDPTVSAEQINEARTQYNKTIAQAKELRDQQIENARQEYRNSLESGLTSNPQETRMIYLSAIQEAKVTYEQSISDAKQRLDEKLDEIRGDKGLEQKAKAEYKKSVAEAKKIYNQTIENAQNQYKRIKV